MVCASALLNPNAFPQTARPEAVFAERRLALVLWNANDVRDQIQKGAGAFLANLRRDWQQCRAAAHSRPDLALIALADGLGYLSAAHSVFYELKAFLDLYARLICKLIAAGVGPPGFNKGKVDGTEIAGGRFVNWIRGCSSETVPHRIELAEHIAKSSRDWITTAVSYRDALGHFRDIPGFRHMRVPVSKGPAAISLMDVLPPEMPDAQRLDEYAQTLSHELCRFVAATIPLVPQVETSLLEPWERAAKRLHD